MTAYKAIFFTILGAVFLLSAPVQAQDAFKATEITAPSAIGYWLTENERSVIHIDECVNDLVQLCGNIYWIIDDGMQTDAKNPDPSLRERPMCGLQILSGFEQQDKRHWIDGKIYKADDGDIYNATLQHLPTDKLLVRGYIGMPLFGKSQTWTRVDPAAYPACDA